MTLLASRLIAPTLILPIQLAHPLHSLVEADSRPRHPDPLADGSTGELLLLPEAARQEPQQGGLVVFLASVHLLSKHIHILTQSLLQVDSA